MGSWWQWIAAINTLFVILTIVAFHTPISMPGPLRLSPFNLANEMNLAAWWSSVGFLITGLLAYELSCTRRDATRTAWLGLAIIMLGLSLDEIGSIHERVAIGGWSNLAPYAIAGGILLAYVLARLFGQKATRRAAMLITAAFSLFGIVALQEFLEHTLAWPFWTTGIRAGVEEGTELFAVLLCLLAVASQRQEAAPSSIKRVIPNPGLMKHLPTILLLGLLLHVVLSYASSSLPDLQRRGNPAVWYPVAVFFVAFCTAYWRTLGSDSDLHNNRFPLLTGFIVCSAATVYEFRGLLADAGPLLLVWNVLFIAQPIALILLYVKVFRHLPNREIAVMAALVLLWLLGLAANRSTVQLTVAGIFAYFSGTLFMHRLNRVEARRVEII
jgi:hypothetical protein